MWMFISLAPLVVVAVVVLVGVAFVRLVIVQEATAVAFKYLGRFVYLAMEYTKHHLETDGSVALGQGSNSTGGCWCIWRVGGWVFYIWPFVEPTNYVEQNNPDKFGEGDHVHLGDITPEPFVFAAETAAPESVPLNVTFVTAMRIVNPYKWLYASPKNVNDQVVERLDSVLRAWIGGGNVDRAQSAQGNGAELWRQIVAMGCMPTFEKIESDWGLKIVKESIIVRDVGFDPGYQAALKAASQAKLEADASVEETAGRILRSVAKSAGINVEDADELKKFMKKLKNNPKLRGTPAANGGYKEAFDYAQDQVKRDRAADAGDLNDIRVGNADGTSMSGDLPGLAAVAALFGGRGGGRGNREGGKGGKKKTWERTDEERRSSWEERQRRNEEK